MGKYERKTTKKKRSVGAWIVAAVAIVGIALVLFVLLYKPQKQEGQNVHQTEAAAAAATSAVETQMETEPPVTKVEFPLSLENGSLEIKSLYPFTGINPDCGNQEGDNIAAIELTNLSDSYLAEAEIVMQLADGTQLTFLITDLPAGASAMVFSAENQSITSDAACTDVTCEAVFDETAGLAADRVSVQADGMQITLTNISGGDIAQIVVYCRNTLGEAYFGGVTYQYTINDLPADGTATVVAVDCILGMAEVVRIAIN